MHVALAKRCTHRPKQQNRVNLSSHKVNLVMEPSCRRCTLVIEISAQDHGSFSLPLPVHVATVG